MKNIYLIASLIIAFAFTTDVQAQNFRGLDKSPMDMATYPASGRIQQKIVRIIYSRPQLKGRSLSQLAPDGKVWRTGANEASEVTFFKDVVLGGKTVKAGTYALFTIPGSDSWTIVLNKVLNQWGSYSYNEGEDVIRVNAKVSTAEESLEAFSITYAEANGSVSELWMGWGTTRVSVPLTVAK